MRNTVNLTALATAVPRYRLDQESACLFAEALFGADFKQVSSIFANSGIRHRYAPVPINWFKQPHDWPERNRLYLTASLDLLERVAGAALDMGNTPLDEVGAVVVVSTTGIATPSLDALLVERMGLPRTVQRLPIFGLGCAGGALGLARAAALAAMMPAKAVLLLVVELCTLSFRRTTGRRAMSSRARCSATEPRPRCCAATRRDRRSPPPASISGVTASTSWAGRSPATG